MRASTALLVPLALSLWGCDSCKKDKEPEPTPPASAAAPPSDAALVPADTDRAAATFCADLYAALDDSARCSDADKKREEYRVRVGVHQVQEKVCTDVVGPGARASRLRFDADAARKCVEAARAAKGARGAAFSLDDVDACKHVVTGTRDAGSACSDDLDCAANLHCEGASEGQGTCRPAGNKGDACEPTTPLPFGGRHAPCAAGLACDPEKKCGRVAAIGERCLITEGTSCDLATASCWNGKCRARAEAKGECEFDTDCVSGLYCDRPPAKDKGACATKKTAGAPCRDSVECRGLCDVPEGRDAALGACVSFCGSG
ncbi:MAG: hypothetical protein KC657_16115 [Myxococcales bacterium]|nr:hypothetical protein [Myxococcales bacterium]